MHVSQSLSTQLSAVGGPKRHTSGLQRWKLGSFSLCAFIAILAVGLLEISLQTD